MDNQSYFARFADALLGELLDVMGAVVIEGAKWCGKTETGLHACQSQTMMQDLDKMAAYQQALKIKPSVLLEGDTPHLIDEWQTAPLLWDAVRYEVDRRRTAGQFILTGSAVPVDDGKLHSGTGRFAWLRMRPMTLFESKESNGQVSLNDLFRHQPDISCQSDVSIEQYAHFVCRGGWPAAVTARTDRASLLIARSYVDALINEDIHRVDGVERNPDRVRNMLRSLARNISTLVSAKTLLADMKADDVSMSDKTFTSYMNALQRVFVVENIPAWTPSLRSKLAVRTSPKRQLVDPSLATASLRITPDTLMHDFNTFGFLFESLCSRDMRVYMQVLDGEVKHYHDSKELEADMILQKYDGCWAAVEVKMGAAEEDKAAENLLKLSNRIDTDKVGKPSFLMILTAGQFAYRRHDGVYVVPLACLKP